jgi:hypothetical protein
MSLLFPAFLLGALAIAIPIALHFLRRDVAPEVPFSAVRLLHGSPVERAPRRRLRDLLLLAARVTALALLALAFARPYATGAAGAGAGVHIVAIDRSFSMTGAGRFDEARRMAREAIDAAPAGQRVAVLAFDDRADVIAAPGSVADARAALGDLRAGYGATRYAPVFERALELAEGRPGRLVVVTDLQRAGWEDERRVTLPSTLDLELRDVGPPLPNLAVVDVQVERERVVATVRNTGPARDGTARLRHAGAEVRAAPFVVGADATVQVPVPWRALASGALAVSVDDPEGIPADDTRYVRLDPVARGAVMVIAPAAAPQAGFYVSRALEAAFEDEGVETRVVTAQDASRLADAEEGPPVIVLLATRGLDRRARDAMATRVRAGAGLVVAAGPEVEPDVLSALFGWQPPLSIAEQPRASVSLAATELHHPIFRLFGGLAANLGQVQFARAWLVKAEGWDVIARFTDGSPAVLERREGRGRVVLFASDFDRRWNDFPIHPVFVPFIAETVRYAGGEAAVMREFTVGTVPSGVPAEPGVHALPGGGAVAVNVDPRESSSARLSMDEFDAMLDRISLEPAEAGDAQAREVESRQGWWRYGLMLMLATLVIESAIGKARSTK